VIADGERFGRLIVLGVAHQGEKGTRYYACLCDCGEQSVARGAQLRNGNTRSCGCLQREAVRRTSKARAALPGERRYVNPGGYVMVRDPKHVHAHPNGYVAEHRKVMSDHLGRALRPDEKVHHRNGRRADNRLDNLELMVCHPKGQRVVDVVPWALEIVERYCDASGQLRFAL
jgi:hypothetical protein